MKIVNLILKFLLFIVKEILSFFIKLFLFLIVAVFLIGILSTKKINQDIAIRKNSYVEIDLAKKVYEKKGSIPNLLNEKDLSFYTILEALKRIGNDGAVDGVVLRLDGMGLSYGQIEEMSGLIRELKLKEKKVYAFSSTMNNNRYWLALSADKIIMPPTAAATVNLGGYYSEVRYYKGLLDKLGVSFQVIHAGDYKAYGENYIRDTMSAEYRENMTEVYEKIFGAFVRDVAVIRKQNRADIETKLLSGELMAAGPDALKKLGLIDDTRYYSEFVSQFGKNLVSLNKYILASNIGGKTQNKNKIAVITAEGDIINTRPKARGYIFPGSLIADLEKAKNDPDVKGIVLRINSPGGSALASDMIAGKIRELRSGKPIYVSIGGVAASGGYYIASAGNKIYASGNSITGSIGVVSLIPNLSKLIGEKAAVKIETIQKGAYADLFSMTTAFTPERAEKLQKSCDMVYGDFLGAVAAGRNLKKEDVEKIAGGKVWLGSDARKNGLVDEIGGLNECIAGLARDLELTSWSVVEVTSGSGLNSILEDFVPLAALVRQVEEIDYLGEFWFTPLKYFPYEIR
ncbi:MAG: signal peptide peptidase SppA [Fusobacteriaceae bacterium]|nr:signal peptide peptidase SppA [Fusobacteriaceae bacterium]